MTNIDIDNIRDKLYAKLEPSGWSTVLRHFIYSNDFTNIIQKLAQDSVEGKRFTPSLSKMFSAFYDCPYKDLKVVVIGQDPYPYAGIADGKAFSVQSGTTNVPPSLKFILKEIDDTVYKERRQVDPDLTRWSEQGILLLNIALTTSINKIGQHYLIWQPFLAYLFDMLNWHNPQLIYVYMGKKAAEWQDAVSDNNKKLLTSHPASAAHNKQENWDSGDVFNKVNKCLEALQKPLIKW
jgi:uracil-DNA glycosylase